MRTKEQMSLDGVQFHKVIHWADRWTDKDLCDTFNISLEELKLILSNT
jgi:hypothetical protein